VVSVALAVLSQDDRDGLFCDKLEIDVLGTVVELEKEKMKNMIIYLINFTVDFTRNQTYKRYL
jgi:hypothetical protein